MYTRLYLSSQDTIRVILHTQVYAFPPHAREGVSSTQLLGRCQSNSTRHQQSVANIFWGSNHFHDTVGQVSFKQNLLMNRSNVNKVESLSSSLWKCARNSIVSFSQRIGMHMLQGRLIAHQSDYKNGHDCSCPMSFPQSAYLFFYFARRSAKAG